MAETAGSGLATAADPMRPVLYRVTSTRRETEATVTMTLEAEGDGVPAIAPGQFNMLVSWGAGEVPISVSATTTDGVFVHTIRDVGGVTPCPVAKAQGAVVGVRGPFGRGWDIEAAMGHDLIVVAGGIGLAPVRPVIQSRCSPTAPPLATSRSWWEPATSEELLYREELDGWWPDGVITVRTIVDRGSPGWKATWASSRTSCPV